MQKYYNRKTTTYDGITHDSKKEADRWCELKLLERHGVIKDLERQVEYELIPNQYETHERYSKHGKRLKDDMKLLERRVVYVADFRYTDVKTGETIVEDTKGIKTKDYILKRKMLLFFYKIRVREI